MSKSILDKNSKWVYITIVKAQFEHIQMGKSSRGVQRYGLKEENEMNFYEEVQAKRLEQDKWEFLRRIYEHHVDELYFEQIKDMLDELIPDAPLHK